MHPTRDAASSAQTPTRGRLVLLGGGGHAAVVAESARSAGFTIVGVAGADAPPPDAPFAGVPWLGDPDGAASSAIESLVLGGAKLHAAAGDAAVRSRWVARFGRAAFATVVDPSAIVSPSAQIEAGAFIGPLSAVNARARVGVAAIVNTRAVVEHDCAVCDFAHVSPGAVLCGAVTLGEGAQVGAGAVVLPRQSVGARSIVGAGAVLVESIGASVVAVGVPARVRG
ncbi:MAG: carbonic anhydrase [Phycisphaera sp.]|nr:carbonic anhydrase [Phycisphaera sp.]